MSTKVVKVVAPLGTADEGGVSFAEGSIMPSMEIAFRRARKSARDKGITLGPARVKIIVEQDVIIDG